MKLDIARQMTGKPGLKGFRKIRKGRNLYGIYKIIGNYYRVMQRRDLFERGEKSGRNE